MGVRDFLESLRPSGTPGAPSVAGVPADRATERSSELEAVFALLDDVQAEAVRIGSAAEQEARRRLDVAHQRADAILAEARRQVEAERSVAAASAQAGAAEQARAISADAQLRAAAILAEARARRPALVASVLEDARADLLGAAVGPP